MNRSRIEKSRTTRQPLPSFRQPPRCRVTLWVASLLIAIVATGAHAQVNPGDILVLDRQNLLGGRGLFSVNPASGSRRVISDWNNAAQDPPELPEDAARSLILDDVAVSASGDIVILDIRGAGPGTGRRFPFLLRVNPTNGNRTIISNFRDSAQGIVGFPDSIAFDGDEILAVGEFNISGIFGPGHDALVHIDPKSGFRSLIADFEGLIFPGIGGPGFEGILLEDSLAVDPAGNVFILDAVLSGRSKLYKVDPTIAKPPFTGRILLSDFGDPNQGELGSPTGMAVDASGNLWVTASQGTLPVRQVLFKVDPKTGTRVLVAGDLGIPCAPDPGTVRLAVDASGNILLAAENVVGQDPGVLFSFNPSNGVCTKVTDFAVRAQGELGERLGAVAVAPTLPAPPVDLTISNMEITQAIQNFANDVPLVQDKTTYVRVYPKVDMADRRVGARLRGFRGGAELLPDSPLRPLYPLANVHTAGAAREKLSDSFNFLVPPAWRSGTVTFQAEINFGGAIPETDPNNNMLRLDRTFTAKPPVCVTMIPVDTHGSGYTVHSPGFYNIIERFKSLWPVPEVDIFYQTTPISELQVSFESIEFGPYELPEDSSKVLTALRLRRVFNTVVVVCPSGSPFRTVGMVSLE